MNIKNLIYVLLAMIVLLSSAIANDLKEAKIKTTAQCESCKNRIEKHLNKVDGINFVDLDVETAICTVKYDSTKIELDDIKKEISLVGYDADSIKADIQAYNKLPKCCKVSGKK